MDGYVGTPRTTNALLGIASMEQRDRENALVQERYDQNREDQLQQREISNRMSALGFALKAKTPAQALTIFKTALPDDENYPDFSFVGNKDDEEINIKFPDGSTAKGPKNKLQEAFENIGKDPSFLTDPEKQRHLVAWATAHGINYTAAQQAQEKTPKKGETRTYQKGGQNVTEEWTGTEWKQLGSGPKFKPDTGKTPEEGKTRTFQRGDQTVTEEYKNGQWVEKAIGPKFKPGETSKEDKQTKANYEKMKRIEKILSEVDDSLSLFAEINMDEMSEDDKATLLKTIEDISADPEVSTRHRRLALEYLDLVDTLYEKDSNDPFGIR